MQGKVYPIIESDLLALIHARLDAVQKSGQLEALQKQVVDRVQKNARRPQAVPFITRTAEEKSWTIDPTVVLQQDIADHRGVVFAHQGQSVNPLTRMAMTKTVLFFNGDDPDQVTWASRQMELLGPLVAKPVLVAGDVFDVMEKVKGQVWFDQAGLLTTKWKITHVPAVVFQEGDVLRVREVLP